MNLTIKLTKSVEQNAGEYFEKAKKAKHKLAGAEEAVKKNKIKLEKLLKEKQKTEEEYKAKDEKKRKQQWYEKFRWFMSSEGFLVIGGRDATTNEIIIKKQTLSGDIVFHTDMAGSPFFVIKAEGKEIGKETMKEVADATLTFSRAWKLGLVTTQVFWVQPEQVTKETASGEYVGRGAFIIKGKTNYVQNKINCAIGINQDGAIMAGPVEAVKANCKETIIIIQGKDKPSSIAKKIQHKIGGDLDEIIRALPSGGLEIKK